MQTFSITTRPYQKKTGFSIMVLFAVLFCFSFKAIASEKSEDMSPKQLLEKVLEANKDWLSPPGEDLICLEYLRITSAETSEGKQIIHEESVSYDRPFAPY